MNQSPASSKASEPLPCPFCGNTDEVYGSGSGLGTYCDNCGADGPSNERDGKPVATWNNRAPLAAEAPDAEAALPVAAVPTVTDEPGPLNTLLQIAQFMDDNSHQQQTGVDSWDYASEFDYNLGHAASTIRGIVEYLRATPAPEAAPVAPDTLPPRVTPAMVDRLTESWKQLEESQERVAALRAKYGLDVQISAEVQELIDAAEGMACASHVIAGTSELNRLRAALAALSSQYQTNQGESGNA